MSDNAIVLNVHMEAAPGREKDLEQALSALIAPTRGEPGCLAYRLHNDPQHPGRFMFYEKFADQAALDAHIASPHFQNLVKYRAVSPDPVAVTNVTTWREIGS
jgi:quinol monooxygenase YgiN